MVAHESGFLFFFNDTAATEIYTLSLHDALPICAAGRSADDAARDRVRRALPARRCRRCRSEEHTSELQSRRELACRLLLEKKRRGFAAFMARARCVLAFSALPARVIA